MIRRSEISRLAYRHAVPERTIQKDYVITLILRDLGPRMGSLPLRFKGGTCLKKCYFPDYRFSEDLDFTVETPSGAAAVATEFAGMSRRLEKSMGLSLTLNDPVDHVDGVTYFSTLTGPLGGDDKLKIDVTQRETLFFDARSQTLHDEYSDRGGEVSVHCYSLKEVFLEKLVCMLDPKRIQPRDLFDLDQLLTRDSVDAELAMWHFPDKATFKKLNPEDLRAAMQRKTPSLKKAWETQLLEQVPEGSLPGFEDAERRLARVLRAHDLV